MAFRWSSLARSAKTMALSFARSTWPSGATTAWPKSWSTSAYAGWPGSMSLWARESASRTAKPNSRSMAATALLPLAIPPVSPSRSIFFRLPHRGGRLSCGKFGRGAAEAGGFDGVAHEHGDGHGADAAGNGGERSGNVDGAGMHVADESACFGAEFFEAVRKVVKKPLGFFGVRNAVGANIDDCCAGLDPVRFHVAGFAHGGDDDIGAAEDFGQIARFGMADRDGGVGVHEEKGHGFADDVAAAEDHGIGAFDLDFVAAKNFHAPCGSASNKAGTSADEAAEIDGMEAVHVFGGIDSFENVLGVDLRGKRKLDENAVDVVGAIEVFDDGEQFKRRDGGRRREERAGKSDLFACGDFAFHVELRGGIFADENCGQPWPHARRCEQSDFVFKFGEDLVANFVAVENARDHAMLAFVVRREIIAYEKRCLVTHRLRSGQAGES